jgi:HK97 family phage prohead protease
MAKKSFKLEIKKDSLTEEGTFIGYASVFGNVDSYNDIIEQGAFRKTLKEKKVFPMLLNHGIDTILGTIEANQDRVGLKVKGFFNKNVQRALEIYELLKQGAIKGLSIGYNTLKHKYEHIKDVEVRVIEEIKLFEVSLTPFPANELANVEAVKSYQENLIEEIKQRKDDEEFKNKVLSLFEEPENTSTLIEQPKYNNIEVLKKLQEVFK